MIAELNGSIKVSQGAMNYYYGNYIFGMHITPSTPFPPPHPIPSSPLYGIHIHAY